MKSGFVSIIGRPNVGKSTLLNTIIKEKVAITTNKAGTTRNLIQGVYTDDNVQIVFVDTPGIHKPISKLGAKLNMQAYYSVNDVDIILFIIDGSVKLGSGDMFVIDKLKSINKPVFLIINKIDELTNDEILLKINEYKDLYDFVEVVPVSALKDDNIDRLITVLTNYLPDNVKYFPDEESTSAPIEFRIAEIVREKVMELTEEEVPHSVTTKMISYKDKKEHIEIGVDIIVDRDNLKKIIIGKSGVKLKEIGIKSRSDIEKLLGKQVYLELYVKTVKKWRDKEKHLNELGFNDFNV